MVEPLADHNWDRQRRETEWVWSDLKSKGVDFTNAYALDLQFIPRVQSADRKGIAEALSTAGFKVRFYPDEPTVEATTPKMLLTPESIWQEERRATAIALEHGYEPDGWGFFED